MRFDELMGERRYQRWLAYGQSKLANLLFALELQRRADAAGFELTSTAAHPGYAATNLQMAGPQLEGSRLREQLGRLGNKLLAQSDEMGALPTLYAATEDLPGGTYIGPDGFAEQRGHPKIVGANGRARDEDSARRLWEVSEDLTDVTYVF
jgi:NAD(P)-dependent dehydrogenase (short-subunit alcohol dehydrogenase family)